VGRRIAWLGGTVAVFCVALPAPALAAAESVAISFDRAPNVGWPLNVTLAGVADGVHRLYAYADQGGYACASDPQYESYRYGVVSLSSTAGDLLSAGGYSKTYSYTPTTLFRICAYLDATASDTPDARATGGPAEDPVNKYLENQEPAQPTGSRTVTMPGAIEPAPVNPQAVREYWERVAREARSTVEREHAEHEAQEAQRRITARCVVPPLKGDSLARARRALLHAHCKLGKVSRGRGAHGATVVTGQAPAQGKKLGQGAAVAVTVDSRKH
jgi:hypothetical protein